MRSACNDTSGRVDRPWVIDVKTPEQMRQIVPAEIKKWIRVALEAGAPQQKQ